MTALSRVFSQPVKRAAISTAGTATLVAAVTGKRIRVVDISITAAGAETVNFEDGTTNITGVMSLITGTPWHPGFSPVGIMETSEGALLGITQAGSVQISGYVNYIEV